MNTQYLPPSPLSDGKVTVTAIESLQPVNLFPGLLLVRIHTDTGLIGHGETYYCAEAVQAMIHDWMARRLLGEDALAIESHWRFLYERAANFGVRGTELRALSALDVALWDLLGQVWQPADLSTPRRTGPGEDSRLQQLRQSTIRAEQDGTSGMARIRRCGRAWALGRLLEAVPGTGGAGGRVGRLGATAV